MIVQHASLPNTNDPALQFHTPSDLFIRNETGEEMTLKMMVDRGRREGVKEQKARRRVTNTSGPNRFHMRKFNP